jgi:formylglycine-generating enzyme required for sulfatase activity
VVSGVPAQRTGLIFVGGSPSASPWPGSTSLLCISSPVRRLAVANSGGTAGACNGELRRDFNQWRGSQSWFFNSPFFHGLTVYAQGWYRDPLSVAGSQLSNALRFELCAGNSAGVVPAMVALPPGTFSMGSGAASGFPHFNGPAQQPPHSVTISYDFSIGRTEVTQAEYESLMGSNPSFFLCPTQPVERVSWDAARAYAAALTAQQAALGLVPAGFEYRLPTEAEWEYACRAGTTTEFSFGSELPCQFACHGYSHFTQVLCDVFRPVRVGSYSANAFGLHDLHGNVREWCLDSFQPYGAGALTDPFVTGSAQRVVRGGSHVDDSDACRSAYRSALPASSSERFVGFRVVLGPIRAP